MAASGPDAQPIDVLVVGAGITGIYQLYRAREAGFSAALVEAGSGLGRHLVLEPLPGARFDSESYTYGYLFSQELWNEWEWSEHFAEQPEIERYLHHVVDRFDLRRHMRFDARVTSATYDEAAAPGLSSPTARRAVPSGPLSGQRDRRAVRPHFPDVPGREDFRGEQLHTGLWPATPVDFVGKRVAVVGTGSSGVSRPGGRRAGGRR